MSTLVAEADRVVKTGLQSGSRKVLIAEDDPVSRRVLESFLASWDYETVVASDGAQASRVLQQEDSPSLAILD